MFTPQQFMTMGCDLTNPLIDPYLLAHSIYADSLFLTWSGIHTPKRGLVGTAGEIKASKEGGGNQPTGSCWVYDMTFQSTDGGYFNKVSTGIFGTGYKYYEAINGECIRGAKLGARPYSDNDKNNEYRTVHDKSNDGIFRPRFPKLEEVSSKFTATGTTTPANGTTISEGRFGSLDIPEGATVNMEAGTYFFNGSVTVRENAKLIVTPKDGSYKTTIYVKDRFLLRAGNPNQNKKGGQFIPSGFTANCAVPDDAKGQMLVIAFGTGIEDKEEGNIDNVRAAITFGSNSSVAIGTFIAPNGGAFPMCGSTLIGQLLAKVVKFAFEYNKSQTPGGCTRDCNDFDVFDFKPLVPPRIQAEVKTLEFREDKKDTPSGDNENNDYIDEIVVELAEEYQGDEPLTLEYAISNGSARIGELGNAFPKTDGSAWREGGSTLYDGERAFVESKRGKLVFNKGEKTKTIKILIVDDDDYQDEEVFYLSISGSYSTQSCEGGSGDISDRREIKIISEDPQEPGAPALPSFNKEDRIFEYYSGIDVQKVATILSELSDEDNPKYSITSVSPNLMDFFEIRNGNEIWTTSDYRADYEVAGLQKFVIKAVVENMEGKTSKEATLNVDISPWNDNAFTARDIVVRIDEEDAKKGFIMIPVLTMGEIADDDLPENLNERKIAGLTLDEEFAEPTKNGGYGNTRRITTNLGATVTIENGQIKYDFENAVALGQDFFYYTAIDTAKYDGYETDIFVKSVKVTIIPLGTVTLHIVPQPLRLNKGDPKPFDDGLMNHYNFDKIKKPKKGVAIIFEIKGATPNPELQKGFVKIFDPLGNLIKDEDEIKMDFVETNNGTLAGIAVWNAKNKAGRTVGAGTYLVVVNAEIDYGENTAKTSYSRKAVISVMFSK